jgi:hypothetical protein
LKAGSNEGKAEFKILPHPQYETNQANYDEYHAFMSSMEQSLTDMHRKVNAIAKSRAQLEAVLKELTSPSHAELKKSAQALIVKMKAWDDDMVQRKAKAYDDVDNYANKFTANYLFLINATDSDIPKVNKPSRDRHAELMKEWEGLNARAKEITETDIPGLTRKLWEAGFGAVRVPSGGK